MLDSQFLELITDARDWIADAFPAQEAEAASLSKSEVRRVVNRHYEGGWDAFVADNDASTYTGYDR